MNQIISNDTLGRLAAWLTGGYIGSKIGGGWFISGIGALLAEIFVKRLLTHPEIECKAHDEMFI